MNQNPVVSGLSTAALTEGAVSGLARSGALTFTDADAADKIAIAIAGQTAIFRDAVGQDLTAALPSGILAPLLQGFSIPTGDLGSNAGSMTWTYTVADTALDWLAVNETVTITTNVQASDDNGGAAIVPVVITITGTNDAPLFQAIAPGSASNTGQFNEGTAKTGDASVGTIQGTVAFSDLDRSDVHTIAVAAKAAGSIGSLAANLSTDTTNGAAGQIIWTYSAADRALDYLAAGQQVTQTYTLTVADGKGGTAKQDVSVVLSGANDIPTIGGIASGAMSEGGASTTMRSGALSFNDADLTDRLTTSIAGQNLVYRNAAGVDITAQLSASALAGLTSAFSLSLGDLGSNKGSSTWTYNIADSALDFLGRLETVRLTTTVQVDDKNGGVSTRDVIVTLTGANDGPTVSGTGHVVATVTEAPGSFGASTPSPAAGSFAFADLDITDTHTIATKANGTGYLGTFTPSLTSDTTGGKTGAIGWTFNVADKALDYLAAGQTLNQSYTITIADRKGGFVDEVVDVAIVGTNDAPVFTGSARTTIFEPLTSTLGGPISRAGTLAIADADVTDHLQVSIAAPKIQVIDSAGVDLTALPKFQLTAAQAATVAEAEALAQHLTVTSSAIGTSGSVSWTYSIDPTELKFLKAGETVNITADVTAQDLAADNTPTGSGVVKPITVSLVGANENAQAKSYIGAVLDGTYKSATSADYTVGNQADPATMRHYRTLDATDGTSFRAPITVNVVKDGATFDGVDFRGAQVVVAASNVTFTNCLFDSSGSHGSVGLNSLAGYSNLTVDHCTFDGLKASIGYPDFISSSGDNATISNNIFVNTPVDGITLVSGTVIGNYFSMPGYYKSGHSDAIWVGKTTSPVVIENNVIDWRPAPDAPGLPNNAIRISAELGDVDHVAIKNNVLLGGNNTITTAAGATWTHTIDQVGKMTNVGITDNLIDLGTAGALDPMDRPKDLLVANNSNLNGQGVAMGAASIDLGVVDYAALSPQVGQASASSIIGDPTGNYIVGGAANDTITAGVGTNIIQGGGKRDYITGGDGANLYVYKSVGDVRDLIWTFHDATDKFDLSSIVEFQAGGIGAADWKWLGAGGFTGTAYQIRYDYTPNGLSHLYFDINGDFAADMQIDVVGYHAFRQDQLILERPNAPQSLFSTLWSGTGIDTATNTIIIPFNFAGAPIQVVDGQVVLKDADGTLLPLAGYANYKFLDRTLVQNDANASVDDLYYLVSNPSLWGTGIDPQTEYATTGWKAGRNPNAGFDTAAYLKANPDIAALGINPLQSYIDSGMSEGRKAMPVGTTFTDTAPISAADKATVAAVVGQSVTVDAAGGVLANDTDADGDALSVLAVAKSTANVGAAVKGTYGDLVLAADGFYTYTVTNTTGPTGTHLSDSFAYVVTDVKGGNNAQTLTVSLDRPVTALDDGATAMIAKDGILQVAASSGVLANDADPDADALTVTGVGGAGLGQPAQGLYGTLAMNADGSYSYTRTAATLPAGAVDTFTYAVSDGYGSTANALLSIAVSQPGGPPTISGAKAASILENNAAMLTRSGVLTFTDPDAGDRLTTSIGGQTITLKSASGADLTASLTAEQVTALTKALSMPTGDLGGQSGSATWTYGVPGTALDFLGKGETALVTTTVKATDSEGNAATRDVVVTLTGTNDAIAIGANSGSAAALEIAGRTGGIAVIGTQGGFMFTDPDSTDKHSIVSVSATAPGYRGTLSAQIASDSTGGNVGQVVWSWSGADRQLDALAPGQTRTQVYSIALSDGKGSIAKQDVSVVLTGTNDLPVIKGNVSGAWFEGAAVNHVRSGTLIVTDPDNGDRLLSSIGNQTVSFTTAAGLDWTAALSASQIAILKQALSIPLGDVGTNKAYPTWTYAIADKNLDFIGQNDTLKVVTTVQIADTFGGMTNQDVTVTMKGNNDMPTIAKIAAGDASITGAIVENALMTGDSTPRTVQGGFNFADADITDAHGLRVAPKAAGYIGTFTPTVTTDTTGGTAGKIDWTFTVPDNALDGLAAGQKVTQIYRVSVLDGKGGLVTQDVSIILTGSADHFSFTAPTARALPAFTAGDMIDVSATGFGGGLHAGVLDPSFFVEGSAATAAGHGQFTFDASKKTLFWDLDGTGVTAPSTVATFVGTPLLHNSDVLVI